jgi:hypothetical protein
MRLRSLGLGEFEIVHEVGDSVLYRNLSNKVHNVPEADFSMAGHRNHSSCLGLVLPFFCCRNSFIVALVATHVAH